jgi:Flp pilus assembly protein TadG
MPVNGSLSRFVQRAIQRASALRHCNAGISIVEFTTAAPVLILLGTTGLEISNYVSVTRKVNDLTALVADNGSRMGSNAMLVNKAITETEINDLFEGAKLQSAGLNVESNGRIILSSVELNADGGQTLKWQRCTGSLSHVATVGEQGDGATGTDHDSFGEEEGVAAVSGDAVMLVEVAYDYKPLVGIVPFSFGKITEQAAFNVRDDRDLTQVHNPDGATPSDCPAT